MTAVRPKDSPRRPLGSATPATQRSAAPSPGVQAPLGAQREARPVGRSTPLSVPGNGALDINGGDYGAIQHPGCGVDARSAAQGAGPHLYPGVQGHNSESLAVPLGCNLCEVCGELVALRCPVCARRHANPTLCDPCGRMQVGGLPLGLCGVCLSAGAIAQLAAALAVTRALGVREAQRRDADRVAVQLSDGSVRHFDSAPTHLGRSGTIHPRHKAMATPGELCRVCGEIHGAAEVAAASRWVGAGEGPWTRRAESWWYPTGDNGMWRADVLRWLLTREQHDGDRNRHPADDYVYSPAQRRGQLERLTRGRRARRARSHINQARAAKRAGDVTRSEWHYARAKGLQRRFHNLHACASKVRELHCRSCNETSYVPVYCGLSRECATCRDRKAQQRRARFAEAHRKMREGCEFRGLHRIRRLGGRWSERHFTLTVPHHIDLGPAERVHLLYVAWSKFAPWWSSWNRNQSYLDWRPHWYRAFETTPARDGWGHPHFHVWHYGPFLPNKIVQCRWAAAVTRAAQVLGYHLTVPMVGCQVCGGDHREVVNPYVTGCKTRFHEIKGRLSIRLHDKKTGGFVDYLESWSIGTSDKKGRYMRVDAEAATYGALGNRRLSQGSRGFLGMADRAMPCRECGTVFVDWGHDQWAPAYRCRILTNEEQHALASKAQALEDGRVA